MEDSNEELNVVPELYFLIAKFLSGGPLKETAKTLLEELRTVEVLPRRLDWEGNEHLQSYNELNAHYPEVSWRRLAAVCERALQLARVAPSTTPALTDTSERQLDARLSLLSESLVRVKPNHGLPGALPGEAAAGSTAAAEDSGPSVSCVLSGVWSAVDGRLLGTLRGAGAEITDVCVSSDGALLACGSVERLVRYVERMRPGACHMICAAWSAGGAFLAAGSADHHVRIYSVARAAAPRRVLETAVHLDAVDSIAWAHRGLRFVSGSKDGTAALWSLYATQWRHTLLRTSADDDQKKLKVLAQFHNVIEGQGEGAIFDAKWGGGAGAVVAASDSHGHVLLLGLGAGHPLLAALPTELSRRAGWSPG
ncbi:unnamed protein product [Leptidea sinapis]|uniref:BRWD/PHIP N-terminal domain-containing protein n=1 Tax=Leptidea sinapis TaxID=189913 RepID=A0A5E4QFX8_9NEOP|nr:unnamed protein product [Leptidea sinapis]